MGGDEPCQNGDTSLANSHSQVTGQLISLVAFDWLNIFLNLLFFFYYSLCLNFCKWGLFWNCTFFLFLFSLLGWGGGGDFY